MKCLRSGMRGMTTVIFGSLFFVIPIALLASVRPWVLATIFATLGTAALLLSLFPLPRIGRARSTGMGFLTAAAILAIIHVSGLLEPLYRREGWLLLDMEAEVYPLQVRPGDTLTYTLSTTNTGTRPALARRFLVDDMPYRGMLIYGLLPRHGGEGFAITGTPTINLISEAEPLNAGGRVCTVVYAALQLPELNPANWDWSTTYTEGWDVVGAITSDGYVQGDLDAGATLTLEYSVVVPSDHPAGKVRSARGSLSYRDPQWAVYYIHDLRFLFEETVTVVRD